MGSHTQFRYKSQVGCGKKLSPYKYTAALGERYCTGLFCIQILLSERKRSGKAKITSITNSINPTRVKRSLPEKEKEPPSSPLPIKDEILLRLNTFLRACTTFRVTNLTLRLLLHYGWPGFMVQKAVFSGFWWTWTCAGSPAWNGDVTQSRKN